MEKKLKNLSKRRIYSKLALGILIFLTMTLYLAVSMKDGGDIRPAGIVFIVALALGIGILLNGLKDLKNVEKGLPPEDERSRRIMQVASARAYMLSIWWLLILMWMMDEFGWAPPHPSTVLSAGIAGMALLLAVSWLYTNWKGDIE